MLLKRSLPVTIQEKMRTESQLLEYLTNDILKVNSSQETIPRNVEPVNEIVVSFRRYTGSVRNRFLFSPFLFFFVSFFFVFLFLSDFHAAKRTTFRYNRLCYEIKVTPKELWCRSLISQRKHFSLLYLILLVINSFLYYYLIWRKWSVLTMLQNRWDKSATSQTEVQHLPIWKYSFTQHALLHS